MKRSHVVCILILHVVKLMDQVSLPAFFQMATSYLIVAGLQLTLVGTYYT